MRSHLPLPLDIKMITRDWLTAALRVKTPDVMVNAFEIIDVNHGTCTKIRIRLDVNPQGKDAGIPETIILKGGFEAHSRDMFLTMEKEVYAYRDLFSELDIQYPICYFADNDVDNLQGIVIIEDLVARGVDFCHAQKPQTFDQVAERLSGLAKFHASSWNSPALKSDGKWRWIKDMLDETCGYMARYLDPVSWERFVHSPRGAAVSTRFHGMAWMKASLDCLPILAEGMPRCVLHGDTHLGNLYIDPDGTPGFFDPGALKGPSMVEVAYHIACALDPVDRRCWEAALVQHYLDELERQGVTHPGFDAAMRQYAAFLVLGYCIFLVNEPVFQPEEINTAYTARFNAAMIDNNTLEVLRSTC